MVESSTSDIPITFEVIGITLLALVISLFLSAVFLLTLGILRSDFQTIFDLDGPTLLGQAILAQIVFLFLAFIYIKNRDITVPLEIPSRSDLKYVVGGTLLALTTAVVFSQLLLYFDLVPESGIEEIAGANPIYLIVLAILSVVLIAPAEELLFRGAIQGRLRERFSAFPSIAVASVLFGSLHLLNFTGDFLPIIVTTALIVVMGGILGYLYERTQNLVVPILIHAIYNFVLLVSSYFAAV